MDGATGAKTMPRGDKDAYTDKQKRQAEHIEQGYEDRGVSKEEAEGRAWATVNKQDHGGKQSGSGRGRAKAMSPTKNGGGKCGAARAERSKAAPSAAAKKGWETRRKRAGD
jgi:plasmid stabilization system protein ParE